MATTGEVWSAAFASAGGETARAYDDSMVPQLFEPWARLLLDQAGVGPGDELLDALAVPAGAYDVVTCQQGLQFFGDRQRALGEMRRALRPGGRLGVAVWGPIEQNPPFAALAEAIAEVIGEETATRYRNGPWGLGRADVVRQDGAVRSEAAAHLVIAAA